MENETAPTPEGSKASTFAGVSCTAGTACTAVGSQTTNLGATVPLAERWNGATWTPQPTPAPEGAKSSLLKGVSCTSATVCTAAGYAVNSAKVLVPLAERWNGTKWEIQSTPVPAGGTENILASISCTSASNCVAVGKFSSPYSLPLAMQWDGTKWSLIQPPKPENSVVSWLSGVSCTSATFCVATGAYLDNFLIEKTLAMLWDGTKWIVKTTPNPGAQLNGLAAVSCTSATACTAVGSFYSEPGPSKVLTERWNGVSWQVQETPGPEGSKKAELLGVSCAAATVCTSVGVFTNSAGTNLSLAEKWDGTKWTLQSSPNPEGAKETVLRGISCTSSTACTAVGSFKSSAGIQLSLAERWTGSNWTIHSTPNPEGAKSSNLAGVSCLAASCEAVGGVQNGSGIGVPLAEGY